MNALEPIVAQTRVRVAERRQHLPLRELERRAAELAARAPRRGFAEALARPGLSVIAEHKRRSPSAGLIRDDLALEDVVVAYARGGAAALSILTEEDSFGGSLDDLRRARDAVRLPILRKDFVVDPYQVPEALVAGADAILLIVAALSAAELEELCGQARAFGLDALVEVHDGAELELAASLGPEVIGINNRDLTTLEVDTGRTLSLLPDVPPGTSVVAESGFRTRAQLDELLDAGVDGVLIGEALMRSEDIERACRALSTAV
jgi:indole-3-glycerol phosphate synthase